MVKLYCACVNCFVDLIHLFYYICFKLSLTGSAGPQNSRKALGASAAWISRAIQGPEQSSSTIFCNTSNEELTILPALPAALLPMKELII